MDRYYLNDTEVTAPQGIDGLTRMKSRSRRYFSILYKNIGYSNAVNITFIDEQSRSILLDAKKRFGLSAEVRFQIIDDGYVRYDAYVDFVTMTYNSQGVSCSFWDNDKVKTLERQATTSYSIPVATSVTLNPKRITGAVTHTVGSSNVIVQKSTPSNSTINHAVPLVRPDKEETTLPGQLLTVNKPLDNEPFYRNTTNDVQAFRVSGKVNVSAVASTTVNPTLTLFVYDPSGQVQTVPGWQILVDTQSKSYTLLVRADVVVQPNGWLVLGFRGNDVQRFTFTYLADTSITLDKANDATSSLCRGVLAGDLLAKLISRATSGALGFQSNYFTTGEGRNLLIANGANLRGINRNLTATLQDLFEGLSYMECLALWIDANTVRVEPLSEYLSRYVERTTLDRELISILYRVNGEYAASEILTGFETWRGNTALATDEFNSPRQYVTSYKSFRKTLDLRCKSLIASGTLIEEQRRKQFAENSSAAAGTADADDERLYVICLTTDRTGKLINETREQVADLSGLIDRDTPYNVRLSPRRSLERWAKVLPIPSLTLETSEGNSSMSSRLKNELTSVNESAPFTPSGSLIGSDQVDIEISMDQYEFNRLGDIITVYDNNTPVTGLLMDAVWQKTDQQGPVCRLTLFV